MFETRFHVKRIGYSPGNFYTGVLKTNYLDISLDIEGFSIFNIDIN